MKSLVAALALALLLSWCGIVALLIRANPPAISSNESARGESGRKSAASIELFADGGGFLQENVEWEPVITVHGFIDNDEIAEYLIASLATYRPQSRRYRVRAILIPSDHGQALPVSD